MLALFLATIENNDHKARFEDIYYTYKSYMLKIIFSILKNGSSFAEVTPLTEKR